MLTRGKQNSNGFTLIELLVGIVIIAILAALLLPALTTVQRSAALAKDTGNLKSYGAAIQLMMNEMTQVSAVDILRIGNSTVIDQYTGGGETSQKLLNSALWNRTTKEFAASQGTTLTPTTRAYTLNENVFPTAQPTSENPSPNGWEIDPLAPIVVRTTKNKPLLFTGVYLASHYGAYNWGSRRHTSPIYSGIQKNLVDDSIFGKTLVLFTGGDVRAVDFSSENLPATGSGADPEQWWVRPN